MAAGRKQLLGAKVSFLAPKKDFFEMSFRPAILMWKQWISGVGRTPELLCAGTMSMEI